MERRSSDEHLDELLTRSYAATSMPAGVCPDEGLLAAFIDGGLDPVERLQVTQHAASCPRCAQILAIAAEPPVTSEVPATPIGVRPWLRRWRWMIPMATAATVAGIWIATRDVIPPMPSPASATQESAAVGLPSQSAPPPATTTGAPAAVVRPPAGAVQQAPARTPPPTIEPQRRRLELAESTAAARDQAPASEQAPPPAAAAPPPAVVPPPAPAAATPLRAQSPSQVPDEIQPRADAQGQGRGGGAGGGRFGEAGGVAGGVVGGGTLQERVTIPPETPVRDVQNARQVVFPPVRWRLNGGLIQQSADEGRTWTTAYDAGRRIIAMSTPTVEAGWFVGARGLIVLRFGAGWSAITAPANADIVAVQATDARVARITLADGRVFATSDGGVTWTQK